MTNPDKIVGYCNKLSVRRGENIHFMVSTHADTFKARLVRLSRQRKQHQPIESSFAGQYPGKHQTLVPGSYVHFDKVIPKPDCPSLKTFFRPTQSQRGEDQAIMCWDTGHGLFINKNGAIEFRWAGTSVSGNKPLNDLRWYEVSASLESESKAIQMELRSLEFDQIELFQTPLAGVGSSIATDATFCIAACRQNSKISAVFDGKIESPRITTNQSEVIANWDFSRAQSTDVVLDRGKNAFHGKLVNCPQRAMTGHNWQGKIVCFTEAPEQYGAIAFHSDDLTDANWEPSITWEVPNDLAPGMYGVEMEGDGGYDCIPFVIRPATARPEAKVAFLLPTFSHLAYANERHWWPSPAIKDITGKTFDEIIGETDLWTAKQGLLSVYDVHKDRTGCCHSSWSRPMVNMRPGYIHPLMQGPHQLSADLYITDWLNHIGIDFDIITDHDLHWEGVSSLEPYNVVLTGQHPEYCSGQMLDALSSYTRESGNLMYIGGQGYYTVTSILPSNPDVIEVRRGKFGLDPWYSESGELYHAADGEPGGGWGAVRGREPHTLFGVGAAGVVFGPAAAYYRNEESKRPEFAWIFEGVEGDKIYADGDLMGGPAGFEFDRIDYRRGSPTSTVCLASAKEFDGIPLNLPEDLPSTGEVLGEVRCDIAYYEVPNGGAVFSSSSMAWSTCLMVDDGDNDIARITSNVLRHFAGN
ncbi:MAG: N,N-dimethylformamidase [Planctomycetota bacterium]|jgi:N,N-dimethylformamidase